MLSDKTMLLAAVQSAAPCRAHWRGGNQEEEEAEEVEWGEGGGGGGTGRTEPVGLSGADGCCGPVLASLRPLLGLPAAEVS